MAIKKLFDFEPKVFRNTELIYNNELGNFIEIEARGNFANIEEAKIGIAAWVKPNTVESPNKIFLDKVL